VRRAVGERTDFAGLASLVAVEWFGERVSLD
jgi:hypothetical protein